MVMFKQYRKASYTFMIGLLIAGVVGILLLFSTILRDASSRISDKSNIPHFNTLMVGSYIIN